MNILLLFKYGPISFELKGIFRFSFQLTSPKPNQQALTDNRCTQLTGFIMRISSSLPVEIILHP